MDYGTKEPKRTLTQNSALHLYFQLLAEALNNAGLDMRKVLKPSVDIPWTKESVKSHLWKPIQRIVCNKFSTTELNKHAEIDLIYDTINRHLGSKFGLHIPFPSFPTDEELGINNGKNNLQ